MFQPLEKRLLLAVTPVTDDSSPQQLFNAGSAVYFAADDGVHGDELWKSDGTAAGTAMVKDIVPGAVGGGAFNFVSFNGATYFLAQNKNTDHQLWKTDGTAAGTQLVADIRTVAGRQAGVSQMVVANGKLFMAISGREDFHGLMVSDGTTAGTVKIRDFAPFHLVILGAVNGTVLLNANGGDGNYNELWKTDGTAAGTVLVKDIFAGSDRSLPGGLFEANTAVLNNVMYFGATVNGVRQLWKSDGTTAGTVLVKDVAPIGQIVAFNGALYFSVGEFGVRKLWKSDGTTAGTIEFNDEGIDFAEHSVVLGNKLYYRGENDGRLWRTDGTVAGTEPLAGGTSVSSLTVANGVLYFAARDDEHGFELWKTDGATATATLVKDIVPGQDGSIFSVAFNGDMVALNGAVYFPARTTDGDELWKSDGTAAGTVMVKDINTTPPDFLSKTNLPRGTDPWHVDGTSGDDVITVTRDGAYLVVSRNGKNQAVFLAGEGVQIEGFDGNDTIDASGIDVYLEIQAGEGNDSVTGGSAGDTLAGVGGSDTLFGGGGNDRVDGGNDGDSLLGENGNDTLLGWLGDDTLFGGDGLDQLDGFDGNDSLWGNDGNDVLFGGVGVDSMYGNGGNDHMLGGANSDHMRGNDGRDRMQGNAGNDKLYGGAAGDFIHGQAGNDQINGEGGNDRLYGDDGFADTLTGGAGDDVFITLDNVRDELFGDGGDDTANADEDDVLTSIINP